LESFVLPEVAMTSDGLHFVFRFTVDKVRWWSRKVRTVGVRLDVWGKEIVVEDRMNVPGRGEVESGSHRGDEFRNSEGSVSLGGQFDRSVRNWKVLSF
jgi:hypothetical protein